MSQTTLSLRIDEKVKKQFDEFCTEVGMNPSVAVNLFIKTVVREHRIPFEIAVKEDPFYSDANLARLKKAIAELDEGKAQEHDLIEVSDE
jgi:DNA-damage-inducible protein J